MPLKSSRGLTASFLLSVSLHALLLFLAGLLAAAPRPADRQLIRISLLQPGGGNSGRPEPDRGSPAPPAPPPVAERPAPPVAKAPAMEKRMRTSLAPKPPASKTTEIPRRADGVMASAANAGHDAAGSRGTGQAESQGSGLGKGSGTGKGAGTGNGLQAHCLYCPKPTYPRMARLRGWEGTADVEVVVARDGSVREAQIRRSSGHAVLDDAAVSVARESRFQLPGNEGEALRGLIAYGFRLRP